MQPITKLGTINALLGLKRPQKTVVRLFMIPNFQLRGNNIPASLNFSYSAFKLFIIC